MVRSLLVALFIVLSPAAFADLAQDWGGIWEGDGPGCSSASHVLRFEPGERLFVSMMYLCGDSIYYTPHAHEFEIRSGELYHVLADGGRELSGTIESQRIVIKIEDVSRVELLRDGDELKFEDHWLDPQIQFSGMLRRGS